MPQNSLYLIDWDKLQRLIGAKAASQARAAIKEADFIIEDGAIILYGGAEVKWYENGTR